MLRGSLIKKTPLDHFIAQRLYIYFFSIHQLKYDFIFRYNGHSSTLQHVLEETQSLPESSDENEPEETPKSVLNIDAVDEAGRTALMLAARVGCLGCTSTLCGNSANTDLVDSNGRTGWRSSIFLLQYSFFPKHSSLPPNEDITKSSTRCFDTRQTRIWLTRLGTLLSTTHLDLG